jgi:hypothetical protein
VQLLDRRPRVADLIVVDDNPGPVSTRSRDAVGVGDDGATPERPWTGEDGVRHA